MHKKLGFTLAEVLITLGIIGVVASVTLPSLTLDVEKRKIPTTLSKAMNTLETVNKMALVENEAERLCDITNHCSATNAADKYLSDIFVKYTSAVKFPSTLLTGSDKYTYDGISVSSGYTTKDGISFMVRSSSYYKKINNLGSDNYPESASGDYYTIVVDLNGRKGPNKTAQDVFYFRVDTKGGVFPMGSSAYYGQTDWTTNCPADGTAPVDAIACSASIVENGWQVKYKY